MHLRLLRPLALCLLLAACSSPPPAPIDTLPAARTSNTVVAASDREQGLAALIARFNADSASVHGFYPQGWSDEALDRREAFLKASLDRVASIDFAPLTSSERIDAILLRNSIRADLSRLELSRRQLAEMTPLLTVRSVIGSLEVQQRRMARTDHKAAAAQLAQIPAMVTASRKAADDAKPPLSPVVAQRAAGALDSLAQTLKAWYNARNGFEPDFDWWCEKPYNAAEKAIGDFAKHLREDVAGLHGKPDDPLVGDPIGRQALLDELKNECIAATPEELIAIGEREMAWCTEQARAAAREMGFPDGDWKAAIEKIKKDVAPIGGQAEYVVGVAQEATAFVKERDLVTVPPMCEELWRATMLSPETQRTLPFAVYFPQAIGIAAPYESMSNEEKLMAMRGNNRRFTRIVVPHELIPGHHLQSFMAARERPYRRQFSTPFFVEGWALYWEMKLWDLGWARGPEDRLGMLFWRMHRCARITVSLKFHLGGEGGMTPQQMIDFLCDKVGHERANATAEVRRYIGGDYGPLYQCGYMIGGKQLRALHAELVPGRMNEKAFNDAVLRCGPIPIELLRAELLQMPLPSGAEASWKFDGVTVAPG